MADTQETTVDIIAEIHREYSSKGGFGYCGEAWIDLLRYADRFEAAHKRELSDYANLREEISNLRTALKGIRDDVLDMVVNHKSEDPSYANGLCLSIGRACDMALNSTAVDRCELAWAQMPYEEGGAR